MNKEREDTFRQALEAGADITAKGARELVGAIATLRTERDAAREDTRLAAGELLVDMDEAPPGSLVARLLTACRLMGHARDAALAAQCGHCGRICGHCLAQAAEAL